jgi:hypothetical protein
VLSVTRFPRVARVILSSESFRLDWHILALRPRGRQDRNRFASVGYTRCGGSASDRGRRAGPAGAFPSLRGCVCPASTRPSLTTTKSLASRRTTSSVGVASLVGVGGLGNTANHQLGRELEASLGSRYHCCPGGVAPGSRSVIPRVRIFAPENRKIFLTRLPLGAPMVLHRCEEKPMQKPKKTSSSLSALNSLPGQTSPVVEYPPCCR